MRYISAFDLNTPPANTSFGDLFAKVVFGAIAGCAAVAYIADKLHSIGLF